MESKIGNYTISRTIGEGTFGKVKLGTNIITQEIVAIKILEKEKIISSADVERVKREICILQMLSHPTVVQIYEIIEHTSHIYMIMQYASGGELFDYIVQCTRVKEQEACKFMHQLIDGIEYIHQLGVAHRDLKPENLLIQMPKKDLLIVDFGLSNTFKDDGLLKTACGSPCYAAPEMIAGKPYDGQKTDIWSCGVIMYALLCGYLPFEEDNTQILYKKILTADFHLPRFVSSDAKDLIRSILTVDPKNRATIQKIKDHNWWKLYTPETAVRNVGAVKKIVAQMLPNSIYVKNIFEQEDEFQTSLSTGIQQQTEEIDCEILSNLNAGIVPSIAYQISGSSQCEELVSSDIKLKSQHSLTHSRGEISLQLSKDVLEQLVNSTKKSEKLKTDSPCSEQDLILETEIICQLQVNPIIEIPKMSPQLVKINKPSQQNIQSLNLDLPIHSHQKSITLQSVTKRDEIFSSPKIIDQNLKNGDLMTSSRFDDSRDLFQGKLSSKKLLFAVSSSVLKKSLNQIKGPSINHKTLQGPSRPSSSKTNSFIQKPPTSVKNNKITSTTATPRVEIIKPPRPSTDKPKAQTQILNQTSMEKKRQSENFVSDKIDLHKYAKRVNSSHLTTHIERRNILDQSNSNSKLLNKSILEPSYSNSKLLNKNISEQSHSNSKLLKKKLLDQSSINSRQPTKSILDQSSTNSKVIKYSIQNKQVQMINSSGFKNTTHSFTLNQQGNQGIVKAIEETNQEQKEEQEEKNFEKQVKNYHIQTSRTSLKSCESQQDKSNLVQIQIQTQTQTQNIVQKFTNRLGSFNVELCKIKKQDESKLHTFKQIVSPKNQQQEIHLGAYNMLSTSSLPFKIIMNNVERYLKQNKYEYEQNGPYDLTYVYEEKRIALSVKKISQLTVNVITFTSENGRVDVPLAEQILKNIKL